MDKLDLRFRQIHLDFHTSEFIDGIGSQFNPDEFAATLEKARVNSITCFARCHHGWIYYDTQVNPERRHPHLALNLLKAQIDACHARNIRVPIYTSVQWDHYTADQHPEWLALDEKGCISSFQSTSPFEAGFYRDLCLNSPYVEAFLKTACAGDLGESSGRWLLFRHRAATTMCLPLLPLQNGGGRSRPLPMRVPASSLGCRRLTNSSKT